MCYCLFALFSCVFFLFKLCFLSGATIITLIQVFNGDLDLPWWLLGICLIWILIDQTLVLIVFGMFKAYDPTFKFISENLGEVHICDSCFGCCYYLG